MKPLLKFKDFVNESRVDEINRRLLGKKPDWPFFFQIFAREVDKDGEREKHRVTVGKKDDFNEIQKQVLKDYPHNKYYYTLWKNVRGGFKNIGTNESEELTEDFLSDLIEDKDSDNSYIVKNGFTFTTLDNKKFTIPRKAEIEIIDKSNKKETYFAITKGKLDGYASMPKDKEFRISTRDFEDIIKDGDIVINESVYEGRGPETVKEPKAKDIQVKDKYKKGEGIFYRTTFAASSMVANSKSETSKSVYYARIEKVSKDGRGEPVYVVGWDKVPHNMVIGSKLNESVNEASTMAIDNQKLDDYARSIGILCNGEYGTVYHNELENSVFICLGDSHPFDVESLSEYMKDAISADYKTRDMIKIIIENECDPTGDGWKQIN